MGAASFKIEQVVLFLAILVVLGDGVVGRGSRSLNGLDIGRHLKRLNKPPVKTIKSEDGDIIDCVDIYKQPAFDHPLLKDHIIQMRPSDYHKGNASKISSKQPQQIWRKSGNCPQGTIPIRRTRKADLLRAASFDRYWMKDAPLGRIERAGAKMQGGQYKGVNGKLNIWEILVEPNEFSETKVKLSNGMAPNENIIQAGWMVNQQLFGDNQTRLYTYWTADSSTTTGCFNLLCPGFIQVDNDVTLGAYIAPPSIYDGHQYYSQYKIYKDTNPRFSNWWFLYLDTPVGYWPKELFKNLEFATLIEWDGAVLNTGSEGHHTLTKMGNGHFANEGYRKSSYITNMLYSDNDNSDIIPFPNDLTYIADRPECYSVQASWKLYDDDTGPALYYGGPGIGPNCS